MITVAGVALVGLLAIVAAALASRADCEVSELGTFALLGLGWLVKLPVLALLDAVALLVEGEDLVRGAGAGGGTVTVANLLSIGADLGAYVSVLEFLQLAQRLVAEALVVILGIVRLVLDLALLSTVTVFGLFILGLVSLGVAEARAGDGLALTAQRCALEVSTIQRAAGMVRSLVADALEVVDLGVMSLVLNGARLDAESVVHFKVGLGNVAEAVVLRDLLVLCADGSAVAVVVVLIFLAEAGLGVHVGPLAKLRGGDLGIALFEALSIDSAVAGLTDASPLTLGGVKFLVLLLAHLDAETAIEQPLVVSALFVAVAFFRLRALLDQLLDDAGLLVEAALDTLCADQMVCDLVAFARLAIGRDNLRVFVAVWHALGTGVVGDERGGADA